LRKNVSQPWQGFSQSFRTGKPVLLDAAFDWA
jgi:hypothetical protein